MVNGGPPITDFSRHPYDGMPTTQGGHAAGAPQFIPSTWHELQVKYGFPDFSPQYQDLGYVGCLVKRNALEDVIAGRLKTAVEKCHLEWSSLPGGSEQNQHYQQVYDTYIQYGGTIGGEDTQPAAPIEERSTELPIATQPNEGTPMGAGLVMALVQSLISGFAPLVQQKIGDAITKHGGDPVATASITNAIMNSVSAAVGTPVTTDAQAVAAVAAVQADPTKMAVVQNTALSELDKLAPVLDKLHQYSKDEWAAEEASMDAASARAKEDNTPDQDFTLTISLIAFMGIILVALGASIGIMAYYKLPYGDFLALFSGAVGVILGKYGTRIDYRYGSSRQSAAKDVTIAQMAKVK